MPRRNQRPERVRGDPRAMTVGVELDVFEQLPQAPDELHGEQEAEDDPERRRPQRSAPGLKWTGHHRSGTR